MTIFSSKSQLVKYLVTLLAPVFILLIPTSEYFTQELRLFFDSVAGKAVQTGNGDSGAASEKKCAVRASGGGRGTVRCKSAEEGTVFACAVRRGAGR